MTDNDFTINKEVKPNNWNSMIFSEKCMWRCKNPLKKSWNYTDKLKVKSFVERKLENKNDCNIAKLFFYTKDPNDINLNKLPASFVMKPNHGSGWVIVVKDGIVINKNQDIKVTTEYLQSKAKYWLSQKYGWNNEKQYDYIEPYILFEEYIGPNIDYKIYCFNGIAKFILVMRDHYTVDLYTPYWIFTAIKLKTHNRSDRPLQKPPYLDHMIKAAHKLSEHIDFVRMDFMGTQNKLYFGEFTFTPAGTDIVHSFPLEYDTLISKDWV